MKNLIIIPFLILAITNTIAQENKTIRIAGNADLRYAIPVADRYRYPSFKEGTVFFLNGSSASAKLNYNKQLGEMQFVGIARDTLSLADENTIKHIKIGDNTFYYDPTNGYVEVITMHDLAQLTVKEKYKVAAVEKGAAMGKSSATSSVREVNVLATRNSSVQKLDSKGDVVMSVEKTYFLVDANRRFYKTNKAGFLKLFSKNKKEIENYLAQESIDFQKEEDLKKLLKFCVGQ